MFPISQKGYTTVELLVMALLLGILAVVAASKFVDLGKDARAARIQSLAGSLEEADKLVYTKASMAELALTSMVLFNRRTGAVTNDSADPDTLMIRYGHPEIFGWFEYYPAGSNVFERLLDTDLVFAMSAQPDGLVVSREYIASPAPLLRDSIADPEAREPDGCKIVYENDNLPKAQPRYHTVITGC